MFNCKLIAAPAWPEDISFSAFRRSFYRATSRNLKKTDIACLGNFRIKQFEYAPEILSYLLKTHKLPDARFVFFKTIIDEQTGRPVQILTENSFEEKIDSKTLSELNSHYQHLQSLQDTAVFHISLKGLFKTTNYFIAYDPVEKEILSGFKLIYGFIKNRYTVEGHKDNFHRTAIPWQDRGLGTGLMGCIIKFSKEQHIPLRVNSLRYEKWEKSLLKMGFFEINDIFTGRHYKDLLFDPEK